MKFALAFMILAGLAPLRAYSADGDCRIQGQFELCGDVPDGLELREDGALERSRPSRIGAGTVGLRISLVSKADLREATELRLPGHNPQDYIRELFLQYARETARQLDLGELENTSEVRCYYHNDDRPLVCATELLYHGPGRTVMVGQAGRDIGDHFLVVDLRGESERIENKDAYSFRATAEDWLKDIRVAE